jgi:alanine dehydrogenase
MIVGVPKEIKTDEYRVALTPVGAELLTSRGHKVLVEKKAGVGSGIPDSEFAAAGAQIVSDRYTIYEECSLIAKVKEPVEEEWELLAPEQAILTFFHFAASKALTDACIRTNIVAIAYETMRDERGHHPLLTPMSEVAGRMSIQEAAKYLERPMEGRGLLLGGVPGVAPANVVILGGGVVGTNAAKVAAGLGARVTILDIDLERLRYLDDIMPANVVTLMSDAHNVRSQLAEADVVVGAVLIEGARPPVLVTRDNLQLMKPGAVIVDVAIDQGGCVETSKPTTHSKPTYIVDGVVHYCVTNIPGAVGRTSTYALTNVSLPYLLELADKGFEEASAANPTIRRGVNIVKGAVTNRAVAEAHGLEYDEFMSGAK